MRDCNLILSPFETLDVISCQLDKSVNDHATMHFCGHIKPEAEEAYLKAGLDDIQVKLTAVDELGTSYVLFQGIARDLRIQTVGDLRRMDIDAVSGSYYMDLVRHIRVFQDAASMYDTILQFVEKGYRNSGHIATAGNGVPTGTVLIQYNETDWAFAKRLASHFHCVVVPAYQKDGFHYFFGMPDGRQNIPLSKDAYTIRKAADEYLKKSQNEAGMLVESDVICLEVESRDVYEIGDSFPFRGQPHYICAIHSELVGRELVHRYRLKSKAGLQESKAYNERMIGASLDGAITDVAKDTVQVKISADGIQSPAKWFPYSTVYSSPDGTGWYCMPEVGDSIRLYLPSEHEKEAFVISSVHEGGSSARSNPNHKSLKSKYGKEVLFTPGSLLFTNNNGMSLEISDEEGIKIISDKAILIQSDDAIQIASTEHSVNVVAPESIALTQGSTALTIKDDIQFTGAQVHME